MRFHKIHGLVEFRLSHGEVVQGDGGGVKTVGIVHQGLVASFFYIFDISLDIVMVCLGKAQAPLYGLLHSFFSIIRGVLKYIHDTSSFF